MRARSTFCIFFYFLVRRKFRTEYYEKVAIGRTISALTNLAARKEKKMRARSSFDLGTPNFTLKFDRGLLILGEFGF